MMPHPGHRSFGWILGALGLLAPACIGPEARATGGRSPEPGFRSLEGLHEPSGVAQLEDGRLVVVEDEPSRPFSLLSFDRESETFDAQALRSGSLLSAAIQDIADLEGVTAGGGGFVYAITSHSRKSNGKRAPQRELLVRFRVEDSRLADVTVEAGLRKALTRAFPELDEAAKEHKVKRDRGLNIEALAFDRRRERLWIGFRGPLADGDAILVSILNPGRVFERGEAIRFADQPVLLDLDGGGVRGMAFVPRLGGYLILSQRDSDKKEKPFKLWLWNGDPDARPRRARIDGVADLERAEGVAPVRLGGEEKILLLSDDGNRARRKPANYLLVDYAALRIDPERKGTS